MTRRELIWAVGPLLLLLLAGCPRTGPSVRPVGGLLIVCEPPDAQVFIDDRFRGRAAGLAKRPLALGEGLRRVELRKRGYFAFYGEVTVARGVRQTLRVKLRKEPF